MASSDDIPPSLEADFVALRKVRDDKSFVNKSGVKASWAGEDPRNWTYEDCHTQQRRVTVSDDRVTEFSLYYCTKLTALPDAIGELGALTTLNLRGCKTLAKLPAAIGKLKALKELDLYECYKLKGLDAIGGLKALTRLALRRCSSLKKLPAAIGELGKLTFLDLQECSSLAELPDAIGDLNALERLLLQKCTKLAELPDSIGKLGALRRLPLNDCSSLTKPPEKLHGNVHKAVGFCCLNLLEGGDVSDDVKRSFVNHVIFEDAHAQRLDAIVHKDPVFADITEVAKAILDVDFAALRKLRDASECDELKEAWSSEDPYEWKEGFEKKAVTVEDGRVTKLSLDNFMSLTVLPAAIGELTALTRLNLYKCESLTALPAAIDKLCALKTLNLRLCERLVTLPATIDELGALTELDLAGCSSFAELPDAIGKLKALTKLYLPGTNLVALPESIAGLDALEMLDLTSCTNLKFPPPVMHTGEYSPTDEVDRIKRLLANTTRFLDEGLSAANADDVAKADFLDGAIHHAPFAGRLETAVGNDPALAELTNDKGFRAIDLACYENRRAMQKALYFLGRYEIADGPPEHRSATSLVVRAVDHAAGDDYGRLFDKADGNSNGSLEGKELDSVAVKLGTSGDTLGLELGDLSLLRLWRREKRARASLTKAEFVDKCQRLFGKERKVVIKIFQNVEQWHNEEKSRKGLDAEFVVQTIPVPDVVEAGDESFKKKLTAYGTFKEQRFGKNIGSHAIVMDAADRNLFQIYQSERPDLNAVRSLMLQVMRCVDHVHEEGIVHGDIKMLNVVRLALDNRLRLIDLDAAAKISKKGAESYVCAKFSSAVLPPECFAKLDADQVKQFEEYFDDRDADFQKKVAPKVDKNGTTYVVKTFSLTEDGAPRTLDRLPYNPVKATEAVDYWSLGALLFQLVTGEPLVPSNRDDDCVDPDELSKLASWEDRHRDRRLALFADFDESGKAFDLASKLLVGDPNERTKLKLADAIKTHPFLNPELVKDDNETLKRMEAKVDAIKTDTSLIRKLSEENRVELRRTREVLLKGIFEATEVSTPTAFVILTEKLLSKEELEKEEQKLALALKKDGTGIAVKGTLAERYKEAKKWTNVLARCVKGISKGNTKEITKALEDACKDLVTTKSSWLYLIDELTLEPVPLAEDDPVYPIEITESSDLVKKLLPIMQVGLRAASLVNGVNGIAKFFGLPHLEIPDKLLAGAKNSVEILKQESSVEPFTAVHEARKGEEKKTFRGAALRDLKRLLNHEDKEDTFAGLRRIGDPNDGTAVWTLQTDPAKVKAALEKRAKERDAEQKHSEEVFSKLLEKSEKRAGDELTPSNEAATAPAPAASAASKTKEGDPEETQTVSQKQLDDRLDDLEERLLKKLGTANNGCKCAIA